MRNWLRDNPKTAVWALVVPICLVTIGLLIRRNTAAPDFFDPERLRSRVVVVYSDTGDREEMPLGRLVGIMASQTGPNKTLPADFAILNPRTKRATGRIEDEAEWALIIEELNSEVLRMTNSTGAPSKR